MAAFALSTGGFLSAFMAFVLFAVTMGVLMVLVSLLAGTAQDVLIRKLRASSQAIQRVSSAVLLIVGIGLIYFSVDVNRFRSIFLP